jgi:iron complex outermembrane receptor protein
MLPVLLALTAAMPVLAADDPEPPREAAGEAIDAPSRLVETPVSLTVLSRDEITGARPADDLADALDLVPGVFAQSSRNAAQDTRVSIRGFGARSTFGVRGIRVMSDGIPNTLPDGQSEVDTLDLSFAESIQVVRGPVSSEYGGGGGGILSFKTPDPTERTLIRMRTLFGSHHLSRYEAMATGTRHGTGWVLGLASQRNSGYRDHSRSRQTAVLAKLERTLASGTQLRFGFSAVGAPEAQDPGGLKQSEVDSDRTQARPRAHRFNTGERLDQQKFWLTASHEFGPGHGLVASGWALWRDFSNRLPFDADAVGNGGRIKLDRQVVGGSLLYRVGYWPFQFMFGSDYEVQQDLRTRYVNDDGTQGLKTFEQSETVHAFGPFAQASIDLGHGFRGVAGLRWDWSRFAAGDRFKSNGDQSDTIHFRQLSPRVGLSWYHSPGLLAYANYSTSFQVPTTVELRPPAEPAGFNSNLDPEKSNAFEVGAKGGFGNRFFYDVAFFYLRVRDAIVPFGAGADTFARNAAKVHRHGIEAAFSAYLGRGVSVRSSYTYAHYKYHDYDSPLLAGGSADGNWEPNIPRHAFGGELRWKSPSGAFAEISLRHFSDIEVNDDNSARSDGATISNVRAGFEWRRGDLLIRPFAGVQNWTNVEYNGTVRPNAGFGRYYEPAPKAVVYAGIEIGFSLGEIR